MSPVAVAAHPRHLNAHHFLGPLTLMLRSVLDARRFIFHGFFGENIKKPFIFHGFLGWTQIISTWTFFLEFLNYRCSKMLLNSGFSCVVSIYIDLVKLAD